MPSQPPVRVVVVTWEGAHLLPRCLDSLADQTVADRCEVVVVDNASTDGTDALLAERYPWVHVVASDHNRGFAGGADLGMRDAPGHVVLLNNDAAFAPDAVEQLLRVLDAHPRAGAVTATIVLAGAADDGSRLVNSTGNVVTRRGTGGDRDWLVPVGEESTEADVFGFCGGAALLRREMIDAVGGFDPALFLYYEDTDLSWRMRAHGWDVVHARHALAVHDHAASSGTASPVFWYYNTRNSLIVFTRHAPLGVVAAALVRQTLATAAALVRAPGDGLARARARALGAYLARVPRTMRERSLLWHGARRGRGEIARRWLDASS